MYVWENTVIKKHKQEHCYMFWHDSSSSHKSIVPATHHNRTVCSPTVAAAKREEPEPEKPRERQQP